MPRPGAQGDITVLHHKGCAQIAGAQMHMLLRQKVGRGGVQLQTGGQGDGA